MTQSYDWQDAEDSFLKSFCSITRFPWGSIYLWKNEPLWPKFNFARISADQTNATEIEKIANTFRNLSDYTAKEIWFRIPRSVTLESDWTTVLKKDSDAIVSITYKNDLREMPPKTNQTLLVRCTTESQMRTWWEINSSGRSRTHIFGNSIWPIILEKSKNEENFFYLLKHNNLNVTCGALSKFGQNLNSWGLATMSGYQKMGYSKMYLSEVSALHPGVFYSQIDEDSPRLSSLKLRPGTEILEIEDYYVYAHN